MKLYAHVSSEKASKGQGGNKELSISLKIGSAKESRQVLAIRAVVLPKEASITNSESVVVMLLKEDEQGTVHEFAERLVYSLPTMKEIKSREDAEMIAKGEKQKGEPYKGSQREADDEAFDLAQNG